MLSTYTNHANWRPFAPISNGDPTSSLLELMLLFPIESSTANREWIAGKDPVRTEYEHQLNEFDFNK